MEKSIFDTGFLLAVFDKSDNHHQSCLKVYQSEFRNALLPDVVLPELAYLIKRELNLNVLLHFYILWQVANMNLFAQPKTIWNAPPKFWKSMTITTLIWSMRVSWRLPKGLKLKRF